MMHWGPFFHGNPLIDINGIGDLIAIIGVVFSIIMLIDCLKRRPENFVNALTPDAKYDKLIWSLAILLTFDVFFAGAIVYFFVVKSEKKARE